MVQSKEFKQARLTHQNRFALLEGHKAKMMLGKNVKAIVLLVKIGTISNAPIWACSIVHLEKLGHGRPEVGW